VSPQLCGVTCLGSSYCVDPALSEALELLPPFTVKSEVDDAWMDVDKQIEYRWQRNPIPPLMFSIKE